MSGYPARDAGPTPIDAIDVQSTSRIGFRFAPWLKSLNLQGINSATWSTMDGITLSNDAIVPDEDGTPSIAITYVDVTTAALNSTVKATVEVRSGLNVERRSCLMQVVAL